ncbi:MAG TPA: protein kinase [Chloroflexota bacterium]
MSQANPERLLSGRYRLVREIARGGMAAVWQAHDVLLDRMVAVKLLHPQFADDPEFLERFGREARAAARLSHPNIVPIYDVGEDAQTRTPFIVMELVEGGNLKDRIRREAPLPDADVRSIGAALAATLDYAHQKGLVHRDVKPQNVLLGEDGRPRLTDFGIAQAMAATGLTRTGAVMGSVHYIAPELVRGRQATPQSDVYSLGVVLYEMATGRVPFQAETDLAVALAHVEQTPAAPRALNAHLAPDLERTILRALARSPEQRFLRAADLADALRQGANPAAPRRAAPAVVPVGRGAAQATQRMPTPARAPAANRMAGPAVVASPAPFARRPARPRQMRGPGGGVLALLLALAAVLVALGAGFFGLASLSREGVASSEPTSPPTARPTAAPKPAGVPTSTPLPAATATPEPSATPTLATSTPATPTPEPPSPSPTLLPTPRSIPVPQLRGKTLDEAQTALRSDGLTATVKGIAANIDKDVVADQSPDVGTTLPPGGTVTILVGTGYTAVPSVSNTPRDQALRTLQNNSFRVTVRERRDARIPAGVAIGTNPAAGTILTRGSDVELDISAGR